MTCLTENELIEYADGLFSSERAQHAERHLDQCSTCRMVLAEIAREGASSPEAARAPVEEIVPQKLLHQYLEGDAAHRESIAALLLGALALGSIVLITFIQPPRTTGEFTAAMRWILGALVAYEAAIHAALRRGWYRRWLPYLNSAIEVSVLFAVRYASGVTAGPIAATLNPVPILLGALLVFMAIRARPAICLVAGAVAAVQSVVIHLTFASKMPIPYAEEFAPEAAFMHGLFCIASGVAGAMLARYFVKRTERALNDIREQDLFGKYVIHERIGTGGMGEVSRATYCPEGGFTKIVAVKRIRPELTQEERFVDAFRREVQLSAMLAHPNLVQVLDFGRFRGSYILAMEYVDGLSLADLLAKGARLSNAAVAYLGAELAHALEYVHAKKGADGTPLGLVHRDVNPPNVLLSRIGEVKLADFGVARAAREADGGSFSGKLRYAAPEQLDRLAIDARADIYALGLTLREAAVDSHPHLDAVIRSMLAPAAEERPAAAEVRSRLLALEGELAPYPRGETALLDAVGRALG
jgi:serine/threonine-protein kinase